LALLARPWVYARGVYCEGWRLATKPTDERQADEFAAVVAAQPAPRFPQDAPTVAKAVFDLPRKELGPRETAKIIDTPL
jgi:uncharacterized protein (DUF2267 family)